MDRKTTRLKTEPLSERSLFRTYYFFTMALVSFFYAKHIDIYIPAFRLTIWSAWLMYGFGIFLGLWHSVSPCLKACRGSFLLELTFFALPFEFLLLLVFAQYHPVIAVILLLCAVVGPTALRVFLYREAGARASKPRCRAQRRFAANRLFLVLAGGLLLVPSLLSLFAYSLESPTFVPTDTARETVSDMAEQAADAAGPNVGFMAVFSHDTWQRCGVETRVSALEMLHEYEAEKLGMPPVPISAARIGPSTLGSYNPAENVIVIDLERLQSTDASDALDTILHESFHAYQYYMIGAVDWDAPYAQTAYFDTLRAWHDNAAAYINAADDVDGYYEQPLEADARAFATRESLEILWTLYDAPDE